jgi:hypothetical protein
MLPREYPTAGRLSTTTLAAAVRQVVVVGLAEVLGLRAALEAIVVAWIPIFALSLHLAASKGKS